MITGDIKVVVIGLGSMGRRRIRLLKKYSQLLTMIGVDVNQTRRNMVEKEFGIETSDSFSSMLATHDIQSAFVCTPPLSHCTLIKQCLEAGLNVFTELNLVADGYEENITLSNQKQRVLFISSTFLYREEIKRIECLVEKTDCLLNYTYHVGQYLPDWHPWECYMDFFVKDKRSNGCREILALELPWLVAVFGDIQHVEVVKSKMSKLAIDYNDNYFITLFHKSGHKGSFVVDVVSRKAVRNLEVFGENLYLAWNGTPNGLTVFDYESKKDIHVNLYKEIDQLDEYSCCIVENAYLNEIIAFFELVYKGVPPKHSFAKDKEILKLIDEIEGCREKI